ncbi:probable serine/threonine-protein kinase DDB_G0278509 [Symsagittifera roscoffensis]|uniref:probable serine/threonine-protein kinase DDB_G0278509 n=1 Tax=Symsagittifera roscoffensis TaxID=84072 RepID=UPI00307B4784
MAHAQISVTPYGGTDAEDFAQFEQLFNGFIGVAGVAPLQQANFLQLHLRDHALRFYQTLPAATRENVANSLTALRDHFSNPQLQEVHVLKLEQTKFDLKKDTPENFLVTLQKKAEKAYPTPEIAIPNPIDAGAADAALEAARHARETAQRDERLDAVRENRDEQRNNHPNNNNNNNNNNNSSSISRIDREMTITVVSNEDFAEEAEVISRDNLTNPTLTIQPNSSQETSQTRGIKIIEDNTLTRAISDLDIEEEVDVTETLTIISEETNSNSSNHSSQIRTTNFRNQITINNSQSNNKHKMLIYKTQPCHTCQSSKQLQYSVRTADTLTIQPVNVTFDKNLKEGDNLSHSNSSQKTSKATESRVK